MPDLLLVGALVLYAATLLALSRYALNFLYLTWTAVRAGRRTVRSRRRTRGRPSRSSSRSTTRSTSPSGSSTRWRGSTIRRSARDPGPRRLDRRDRRPRRRASSPHWRERGIDIRHVRRAARDGFKAGALAAGPGVARGTFVAIFDADFIPPRDFLRRDRPGPGRRSGSGLRPGALGSRQSRRVAADQPPGTHHRRPLRGRAARERGPAATGSTSTGPPGSGAGRRSSTPAAGAQDTLTEDLDISYRRIPSRVAGRLPRDARSARRAAGQHQRLSPAAAPLGARQPRVRPPASPAIWRSNVARSVKAEATIHLLGYSVQPLLLLLCVALPVRAGERDPAPAAPRRPRLDRGLQRPVPCRASSWSSGSGGSAAAGSGRCPGSRC